MKHAREDYNRIQDPANIIPEDEPVFLLRASDMIAPTIVREWGIVAMAIGVNPKMANAAFEQAIKMQEWQRENGFKKPDMPLK